MVIDQEKREKALTVNRPSSACVLPAGPRKPKEPPCPDATANLVPGSLGTGHQCSLADAFPRLEGLHVLAVNRRTWPGSSWWSSKPLGRIAWCRGCVAQSWSHARRNVPIHDNPALGSPVVLHWRKWVYRCHENHAAWSPSPRNTTTLGRERNSQNGPVH